MSQCVSHGIVYGSEDYSEKLEFWASRVVRIVTFDVQAAAASSSAPFEGDDCQWA